MSETTEKLSVEIFARAEAVGKMRNDIEVYSSTTRDMNYFLPTDEGPFHGGDATAPSPISYFCAGLTGCFMTQVRAFAKKMRIEVDSLKVNGAFRWEAALQPDAPYVAEPVGFDFDIEIDSPASVETIRELIHAAKEGCFVEKTMRVANDIGHKAKCMTCEIAVRMWISAVG